MCKSRKEMLASMDADELVEWEALYTVIEVLPEERADLRSGMTIANLLSPHLKTGAEPLKVSKFMPKFDDKPEPPPPGQSQEDMRKQWEAFVKD